MTIPESDAYHPYVMSRVYRVLFLDAGAETGWANLVRLRNVDYARYLSPPDTAAGTYQRGWSIRTDQLADTVERLNEKWHRAFETFISTAIESGSAKRLPK